MREQLALPLVAPDPPIAPVVGPVVRYVRRRGARRYILRVLDDGTVRVTVPWWGRKAEAAQFLASQQAWVTRQLEQRRTAPDRRWRHGAQVLVDGAPQRLAVEETLDLAAVSVGADLVGRYALVDGDARAVVEAWLRARARATLPDALGALAARYGIAVTRVSIRNQQSRWGSCSRRGTICLNWRLVQLPPAVREYVLVHELMHRRQMNHSAKFWALVAAACPEYLAARRWLRTDGMSLF